MATVKISALPDASIFKFESLVPESEGTVETFKATGAQIFNAVLRAQDYDVQTTAYAATTTNLVGTYNNGTAGVGATITITATGAFTTDGVTPPINSLIMVPFQTTKTQNGPYILTNPGAVGVQPVLTRSPTWNEPSEIVQWQVFPVTYGSTYGNTAFQYSGVTTPTIGTTLLPFIPMAAVEPSNIQNMSYSAATASAGATTHYTATFSPALTAIKKNQLVFFQANHTSVGGDDFNPDGLGAGAIVKADGSTPIEADDIINGQMVALMCNANGGAWQLMNPSEVGSSVTPQEIQNWEFSSSTDSGAADAYVGTYVPAPVLVNGTTLELKIGATNLTSTPTFNAGGGALGIILANGDPVPVGAIPAGMVAIFSYDTGATKWQIINPFDSVDSVAATRMSVNLPGIQTIPLNTTQDVQFSNVLFDSTGWFDSGTYTWEPQGTGEVNMFIGMSINTSLIDTLATSPAITLLKNGSPIKNGSFAGTSPNAGTLSLGGVIQFAPGDIFKVTVFNSSMSASITLQPGQAATYWDISSVSNAVVPFVTPLALDQGGTAKSLTADNGGIVYSDADSFEILAHTTTALQVLQSGNASAPAWSTATYPATTTINQLLYSSAANVIGGVATANSATLITDSSGVPVMSSAMTNGQLIIGSTGNAPTAATLTAGAAISITNGAGSITVASTASALTWNNIAGTTQAAAVNNGYVVGNASQTTITLPATAALGSVIAVQGKGAAGWILTANTGQTIHLGASVTSSAGSLTSVNLWDSVEVVCVTADTVWSVTRVLSAGLTIT
ncbi:MAG: hypothetical protein V4501_11265 [Pseudomonadota bacterium]